ncbi:MAG TPA: FeoA domain-containing protein [Terrimicrobiaceae bacterium]|nr:FeoA domain-containing protein [Terrimicrobiaceae bacterium]
MNDLRPGEEGVILRVRHGGGIGQRLMALGLLPGCRLKFLRHAPLGDPLMAESSGFAFCVRRRDACLIELEPSATP